MSESHVWIYKVNVTWIENFYFNFNTFKWHWDMRLLNLFTIGCRQQANITSHQSRSKNSRFRLLFSVFLFSFFPPFPVAIIFLCFLESYSWKIHDKENVESDEKRGKERKLSWFIMLGAMSGTGEAKFHILTDNMIYLFTLIFVQFSRAKIF